jgi:hypothetical protein
MSDTIFCLGEKYPKSYLVFLEGFTDFDRFETPLRGYRFGVYLNHNGKCYPLCFYTPFVLAEELENDIKWNGGYIAEYGMVIIDDVTLDNMLETTRKLLNSPYFDRQKSYSEEEIKLLLNPYAG